MAQQFSIITGRLTVAWRAAALAVAAAVFFASAPESWARIGLQILVPLIGVTTAWAHVYPDWLERYRNSRIPILGALIRHEWDTTNRIAASFPGIMETLGGISLVTLTAGPWALPLGLSSYLLATAATLLFYWSVGRNIMIGWAWYKPGKAFPDIYRAFRLAFPLAAAVVIFIVFFSTPVRHAEAFTTYLAIAGLAAAVPLSLYPLVVHYELALQAAQAAIDLALSKERIISQVHIHSLIKNPLYVLANELRSRGLLNEHDIAHYFRDVQFGIEEARRIALLGDAGRSAYLPDIVTTISNIFPQGSRPKINLAPGCSIRVVSGEDYLLVRALLLDLVTNAVKAEATEVEVWYGRDSADPSRVELRVRDDADGAVVIPEESPARTSLAIIKGFLSSATQGPGTLKLSESQGGRKSVIANWVSVDPLRGDS
jgi:hypothetical protein